MLWFHSFNRNSLEERVDVLIDGKAPSNRQGKDTLEAEEVLEIDGPCVYAYFGRSDEVFGRSCIAIKIQNCDGDVTPFDTGGLMRKIKPIADWNAEDKAKYLKQYSWPFDKFDAVYAQYPGNDDENVNAYKDSVKPKWEGPHDIWGGALVSNIWSDKNEWRAWIWELRSRGKLKTSSSLVFGVVKIRI